MFRTFLFWTHLVAGVVVGVLVLVMSFTGVVLTYEKQINLYIDTRAVHYAPPQGGGTRLGAEALLNQAVTAGLRPSSITLRADDARPASISTPSETGRGERTRYVDPYSGAVLGEGSASTRQLFRTMEDWHRWLGREGSSRGTGKMLNDVSNLLFLFIVVSGLYLWMPRSWTKTQVRQVLWFRGGLPARARDFNWHHVIGFWCCVPLFVVVLAGVVMSYGWAGDLVFRAVGEAPPQRPTGPTGPGGPGGPPGAGEARGEGRPGEGRPGGGARGGQTVNAEAWAGLDALVTQAQAHRTDWQTLTVRLPRQTDSPVSISVDAGMGGEPQKRDSLTFDRAGAITRVDRFSDGSPGRQWRTFFRFAHTGEYWGALGQTIAGLASLGACVLFYTGIALSWRRFRSWQVRAAR